MIERTTVRLPKALLDRARRKAAAEGRTLTSLLEEGLSVVISGAPRPAKTKRVLPPISSAVGGTMPGIDLTKPSVLEEQEDLERLERTLRAK